ncbi:di-heme oxidoredictase family protein [Kistimonas asteriae]|uniref:di-heme oxidoreductase family protein n=1 Tax=Kistimonas asteriae TaxID=517724 RepID=UPI001BAA83E3|nr:di-heme oxidoredictase family protein [Kistimonas asteriae]
MSASIKHPFKILLAVAGAGTVLAVTGLAIAMATGSVDYSIPEPHEHLSGGKTTVFNQSRNAFSLPSANMPVSRRLDFSVGNSFFRNLWVMAPASTDARDGLGPLFNTNGCQNCHIKDGRGHAPAGPDDNAVSMLIRLSIPAVTAAHKAQLKTDGSIPDPVYGGQLQDFSLTGVAPEGKIQVTYSYQTVTFANGDTAELRKPSFTIEDKGYGEFHPDIMFSPRVAPPMIGLGLLEAIPEHTLQAYADPDDRNNDGISGRLNQVWDAEKQTTTSGRFGWKAGQPNLRQQNAAAFNGDLGITSSLFQKDHCTSSQQDCLSSINGGDPELSEEILNFVTFYSRNLAVPARRNVDVPEVLRGKQLFNDVQCAACHIPQTTTAQLTDQPEQSGQTIWPYTDLLLHDMGEELADNRPEFLATGQEWRTPPLWGIGLTKTVNGHTEFLHDGRARNLTEAILWHGGEAEQSREHFVAMPRHDRRALLAFLESL